MKKKLRIKLVKWLTIDVKPAAMQQINVWRDYDDRAKGTVGACKDKEKVKLIKKNGARLLIELKNGERGYITEWFVKEYQKNKLENKIG